MPLTLLHFLLVEDDDSHAEITTRSLRSNRVVNTIDRVCDGVEALDYLYRRGEYARKPRPDVILLDLKLPRMDGHEVLAKLKEDAELRSIPVVVLTTSAAEGDLAKAYAHHANSYLIKPLDFGSFKQLVNDLALYWGMWNTSPGPTEAAGPRPVGATGP